MPFLVATPFLVVLVTFAAIALAALQPEISRATAAWLKDLLRVGSFIAGPIAVLGLKLTRWATQRIGAVFIDGERLAVGWLTNIGEWYVSVIGAALAWPIELLRVTFWLLDVEIPRLIRALPGHAAQILHTTITRVVRLEHTTVKVIRLTHAIPRQYVRAAIATLVAPYLVPLHWLRAHFHAMTAVIPHTLPIPFGRTITAIRKRLRRLERITAGGVAIGAVAIALGRLGLGWVRCTNVVKTGKALCKTDLRWLENALAGLIAIFGTLSIFELAAEIYSLVGSATAEVAHFWRADVHAGSVDPGLGEWGGAPVTLRAAGYVSPAPGLGDVS